MALTNAAAGFIGASVTLVLVIIFMILMVVLVRQCLAFVAKKNAIRAQVDHQRQVREQIRQRRGSVTEPIPATFDWHHSIRIAGTPPPSYVEAKKLPALSDETDGQENNKASKREGEAGTDSQETTRMGVQANGVHVVPVHSQNNVDVVVQVEEGISTGGSSEQNTQGLDRGLDQARMFTTGYTEFSSA